VCECACGCAFVRVVVHVCVLAVVHVCMWLCELFYVIVTVIVDHTKLPYLCA
jgi:hypothetical protein